MEQKNIPHEKLTKKELAELNKIQKETESGKKIKYVENIF